MALNIKNREVEELAAEVAKMAGESKTEAIRKALAERRQRLEREWETPQEREARLRRFLEEEIWVLVPPEERGKPISKAEQEEILGFGEDGV